MFLDLGDLAEGHGDSSLLADAALDLQRFLVVPLRFARLVQPLVGGSDGVEHVGLLFVLPELDGQAEGLVQEVERSLRVSGLISTRPEARRAATYLGSCSRTFL